MHFVLILVKFYPPYVRLPLTVMAFVKLVMSVSITISLNIRTIATAQEP